jgi:hypothetical protein
VSAPHAERRARRFALPDGIAETLAAELTRLGMPAGAGELGTAWAAAVGADVARNAWPARVTRDGTLLVHTSSSAWAEELSHLEPLLRSKLESLAPLRIRFAVGPLPDPSVLPVSQPPEPDAAVRQPTPAQRAEGEALAFGIEDDQLRRAVARLAAHVLARGSD